MHIIIKPINNFSSVILSCSHWTYRVYVLSRCSGICTVVQVELYTGNIITVTAWGSIPLLPVTTHFSQCTTDFHVPRPYKDPILFTAMIGLSIVSLPRHMMSVGFKTNTLIKFIMTDTPSGVITAINMHARFIHWQGEYQ